MTPITDFLKWNLIAGGIDPKNDVVFARDCADMETLLEQLANKHREALDRIKRLEEAGDAIAAIIGPPGSALWADEDQVDAAWNNWTKAKEDKC